jgi:predicted SPOUT superfamily RNA methylase MTH1
MYRADQNSVNSSRVARLLTFAGYVARIVALQNISEIISFPDDLRIATNAAVDKIPDVTQR